MCRPRRWLETKRIVELRLILNRRLGVCMALAGSFAFAGVARVTARQGTASQAPAAAPAPAPTVQLAPEMPPLAPPRPFVFPKVATKIFENGLRVFVASDPDPDHAQPSVS